MVRLEGYTMLFADERISQAREDLLDPKRAAVLLLFGGQD